MIRRIWGSENTSTHQPRFGPVLLLLLHGTGGADHEPTGVEFGRGYFGIVFKLHEIVGGLLAATSKKLHDIFFDTDTPLYSRRI